MAPATPVVPPYARSYDGSAASGYRVGTSTAAGPIFTDLPIQDTPYSITVVPHQLLENIQAYNPEDIARVVPQITNVNAQNNTSGNPFYYIRGFAVTQFTNLAGVTYDGLQGGVGGQFNNVLEDKERVEVLSGVNGFLYGTGSVGGNINYVLKRPTETPYNSVTVGNNAGANEAIHGDFGGPLKIAALPDGLIGYRINLVGQDGHTSIYNQTVRRNLLSAAFDIHLADNILLQLNAAHSDWHTYGLTPSFSTTLNPYPAPANPAKIFDPSFVDFSTRSDTGGAKLTWNINSMFTVRSAYDYTREVRPSQNGFSTVINNYSGLSTQTERSGAEPIYFNTNSGYAFLDTEFSTFGAKHKLTTGFTGYSQLTHDDLIGQSFANVVKTNNFYDPQSVFSPPNVVYNVQGLGYTYGKNFAKNYVVGDEIKFGERVVVLAGANYTSLGSERFNISGTGTSGYSAAKLTPSVSLLYKLAPWFTTYTTFQESLQPGVNVVNSGGTIFTNNGTVLPPYLGYQYEVGAKATVADGLLLTAALFDIDKANQFTQANTNGTFTVFQSGREVHKGVEFTAVGKLTEDLTIFGGLTFFDARVTYNPAIPQQSGSIPQNVSPYSEKIYAEYNLPFVPGLTLVGGLRYNSFFYAALPTAASPTPARLPGYAVEDIGFRYTTKLYDKPLIVRFNVNNVGNTAYFQSSTIEGLPRTFLASAEMKF